MLWTCSGFHLIFIHVVIKVQMFLTLQNPCVMFLLNFLALLFKLFILWRYHLWYLLPLLPQLSLLWKCYLWYFRSLFSYMYHYWQCRWFHLAPHHFFCPYLSAFMSFFIPKLQAFPSSTLLFPLKAFIGKYIVAFF